MSVVLVVRRPRSNVSVGREEFESEAEDRLKREESGRY